MARTFLLAVILSVLILFAASAAATPESLICEINKIRAKNGLLPYALSEKIIKAAQIHTNYMIKTKTVEHNQNNGLDFHERLTSVGLKYSDSAENLGGGFKSDAAILKNYWMRARQFKGHVLNKGFTHMGSWSDKGYYTADFATVDGYVPNKHTPLCPNAPSNP